MCAYHSKKGLVGLIPKVDKKIPPEALDETILRIHTELEEAKVTLPFCTFNGGHDAWVDVGTKRVGVQVLQFEIGRSSNVDGIDEQSHGGGR